MKKRIIGVTGGIGAGKSTVLACLKEEWNARIIQADVLAKEIMEPGGEAYDEIVRYFGSKILLENGTIDRKKLAEVVFADDEKRRRLNALVHGKVRKEAEKRIHASRTSLVAYEAALPKEASLREICDEVWFVLVPEEERISRLMRDRGYSRDKAVSIIRSQLSDKEFLACADRVIDNSGTPEETRKQVAAALGSPCTIVPQTENSDIQ